MAVALVNAHGACCLSRVLSGRGATSYSRSAFSGRVVEQNPPSSSCSSSLGMGCCHLSVSVPLRTTSKNRLRPVASQVLRQDRTAAAETATTGRAHSKATVMRSRTAKREREMSDKAQRKERSKQLLLDHLAEFVKENQQWLHGNFPTREYLSNAGRIDLAEAIRKLGGPAKVADMFGLKWGVMALSPCARSSKNGNGKKGTNAAGKSESEGERTGGMKILDQQRLEKAIAENVEKGQAFMVEHTSSKIPMREDFWTLWKPPITAGTTQETVTRIFEESWNCSRHHPKCYVRITAFDKNNFSRKITYTIHEPHKAASSM